MTYQEMVKKYGHGVELLVLYNAITDFADAWEEGDDDLVIVQEQRVWSRLSETIEKLKGTP
jgi:hypothetical protein